MACTGLSIDARRAQQEVSVPLLPQPVEYTTNLQLPQQALLGFRFDFAVTQDGQVVQLSESVNSGAIL